MTDPNGGTNLEEIRRELPPNLNLVIERCEVSITLLANPKRAQYAYNYSVAVVGDRSETEWPVAIPSSIEQFKFLGAGDAEGGLQHAIIPAGSFTKIPIRFRRELTKGSAPYTFWYSYETSIRAIVSPTLRGEVITYTDWFMSDNSCDLLKVCISLPKRAIPVQSFPPISLEHNPVCFSYEKLRPLELSAIMLAYQKNSMSKAAWLWIASMLISGLVGALIGKILS